jgi:hypothetical protein
MMNRWNTTFVGYVDCEPVKDRTVSYIDVINDGSHVHEVSDKTNTHESEHGYPSNALKKQTARATKRMFDELGSVDIKTWIIGQQPGNVFFQPSVVDAEFELSTHQRYKLHVSVKTESLNSFLSGPFVEWLSRTRLYDTSITGSKITFGTFAHSRLARDRSQKTPRACDLVAEANGYNATLVFYLRGASSKSQRRHLLRVARELYQEWFDLGIGSDTPLPFNIPVFTGTNMFQYATSASRDTKLDCRDRLIGNKKVSSVSFDQTKPPFRHVHYKQLCGDKYRFEPYADQIADDDEVEVVDDICVDRRCFATAQRWHEDVDEYEPQPRRLREDQTMSSEDEKDDDDEWDIATVRHERAERQQAQAIRKLNESIAKQKNYREEKKKYDNMPVFSLDSDEEDDDE